MFKVGDLVRIKPDLVEGATYDGIFLFPFMSIFRGTTSRVRHSDGRLCTLDNDYIFSNVMLEPVNISYTFRYVNGSFYRDFGPGWSYGESELERLKTLRGDLHPAYIFNNKGSFMTKVRDLFKSKQQRLFEKYLFDSDGNLNFQSPVLQKVILVAFKKELLAACMEEEKNETR